MTYQVVIKRSAEKELTALPSQIRARIAEHLLALEENPRPFGIKKYKDTRVIVCASAIIVSCLQLMTRRAQSPFTQLGTAAKFIARNCGAESLQRKIDAVDAGIDTAVYRL